MVTSVIVVLDEARDLGFEITGQIIVLEQNADLLFSRVVLPGCPPDVADKRLGRRRGGVGFLSHLRSLRATMSQKSSVPQAISFVSQVLKRDTAIPRRSLRTPPSPGPHRYGGTADTKLSKRWPLQSSDIRVARKGMVGLRNRSIARAEGPARASITRFRMARLPRPPPTGAKGGNDISSTLSRRSDLSRLTGEWRAYAYDCLRPLRNRLEPL